MKFTEKYRREDGRKRADLNMKYVVMGLTKDGKRK
jgi:hypothetical protein